MQHSAPPFQGLQTPGTEQVTRLPRNRKTPPKTLATWRARSSAPPPPPIGIPTPQVEVFANRWLADGQIERHSGRTTESRRETVTRLIWLLQRDDHAYCDLEALRAFMLHCAEGHKESAGRWGIERLSQPLARSSVASYYRHLHAFFEWMVRQEFMPSSPMDKIPVPDDRWDQPDPYEIWEEDHLLAASKQTAYPHRDYAIALLLLDTGMRASELAGIQVTDIDVISRRVRVHGKGDKERVLTFDRDTAKALFVYEKDVQLSGSGFFFLGERGPLTRSGVFQIVDRWGLEILTPEERRRLKSRDPEWAPRVVVDSNVHRFRHTFAVRHLASGGNEKSLMLMLGHNDVKMTMRYVKLVDADIARQHAAHSPVGQRRARRRANRG